MTVDLIHDVALTPLPRAPTQEAWDAMTPAQRAAAEEALPLSLPVEHVVYRGMAEGDEHGETRFMVRDTLRRWFHSRERQVYVGSDIAVYYPGEEMVTPDAFAVRDVPTHDRLSWMVSKERKGVEWVFEVLVRGSRVKDLKKNVARYASLGILEYFVLDLRSRRIQAWRQASPGVREFAPVAPHNGAFASDVLGLEMLVVGRKVRFRQGTSELLTSDDLIVRLEETVAELAVRVEEQEIRAEAEAARAAQEAARAAQEASRADAAEREVAAMREELARLRGR